MCGLSDAKREELARELASQLSVSNVVQVRPSACPPICLSGCLFICLPASHILDTQLVRQLGN